jgi:hypothetical protein
MFFDKIKIIYFIAAFAFGLFLTYITSPKPNIVIKFPTPSNSGKITYKDKANNCYKYEASKLECPADSSLIKKQPLALEDFKQ